MAEKTLIARIHPAPEDPEVLIVASPVVGMADGLPRKGNYLNRFDRVLTVKILGQRHTLRLPRDVEGRITETYLPDAQTAVAFDEPLVRIDRRAAVGGIEADGGPGGATAASSDSDVAGAIQISAPSEGIFYRRPSPETPPYVEVGARIRNGSVLGLVEVMKCFNQITYGGVGFPETAEVVKILAEDNAEVAFGQPLFWVRPDANG